MIFVLKLVFGKICICINVVKTNIIYFLLHISYQFVSSNRKDNCHGWPRIQFKSLQSVYESAVCESAILFIFNSKHNLAFYAYTNSIKLGYWVWIVHYLVSEYTSMIQRS